jgi:ComF family protein
LPVACVCRACARRAPPVDAAWSAFALASPVRDSIHALKYHASFVDARLLGELMAQRLRARAEPLPRLLVPVPLHASRLRTRGYNQAQEVGRVLARALTIELVPRGAVRVRATEDQIGKTRAQRRRNVRGAFRIEVALEGAHLALLDDVMTTGATLHELARACRAAGAARVEAWSIARQA